MSVDIFHVIIVVYDELKRTTGVYHIREKVKGSFVFCKSRDSETGLILL